MKTLENIHRFCKRYWLIPVFIIMLLLPVVFTYKIIKSNINMSSADYVQIGCTILTYVVTLVFSVLAVIQNKKAHEMSRMIYKQSERLYIPQFIIQDIEYLPLSNCGRTGCPKINFCQATFSPNECEALKFTMANYSEYPITGIHLDYIYTVGKKDTRETCSADHEVIIAPKETYSFSICDNPTIQTRNGFLTVDITCSNMFGFSSTVRSEIYCFGAEGNKRIDYKLKLIINNYY